MYLGRMTILVEMLYQAKIGDGFKQRGWNRKNSFFKSPREAVSEALALKEKMDVRYKDEIKWEYNGKVTGTRNKMKFLKGYLGGDTESKPFYLQIVSVKQEDTISPVSPVMPKKITNKDKQVMEKIVNLFN